VGDYYTRYAFTRAIAIPLSSKPVAIAAGCSHSAVLDDLGNIFTAGRGDKGQVWRSAYSDNLSSRDGGEGDGRGRERWRRKRGQHYANAPSGHQSEALA